MTPIQRQLLAHLAANGPVRSTAQIGYALWPDRAMQPQGAAVAAGKVIRGLRTLGFLEVGTEANLAVYDINEAGRSALEAEQLSLADRRQMTLLDE
jgi:hypothetical protein